MEIKKESIKKKERMNKRNEERKERRKINYATRIQLIVHNLFVPKMFWRFPVEFLA